MISNAPDRASIAIGSEWPLMLAADVDGTLIPGWSERHKGTRPLDALNRALEASAETRERNGAYFAVGIATGNSWDAVAYTAERFPTFRDYLHLASFAICSVGTDSRWKEPGSGMASWQRDGAWPPAKDWDAEQLRAAAQSLPGISPQPKDAWQPHKLSFYGTAAAATLLRREVEGRGLRADILYSRMGTSAEEPGFIDLLPAGVNKGSAARHVQDSLARRLGGLRPLMIGAGDSGNDRALLETADFAIVPANASDTFKEEIRAARPSVILTERRVAAGVMEGLRQLGVLPPHS